MTDQASTAGVILGRDERIVSSDSFALSLVLFFLRTTLVLTDKRIAGESKNTVFGFLPVGGSRVSYPLNNVASVATSTRINILGFLVGIVCMYLGLHGGATIALLVLGVLLFLGSFQAVLVITNNAGNAIRQNIAIFEKGKAQAFANATNTTLANRP